MIQNLQVFHQQFHCLKVMKIFIGYWEEFQKQVINCNYLKRNAKISKLTYLENIISNLKRS